MTNEAQRALLDQTEVEGGAATLADARTGEQGQVLIQRESRQHKRKESLFKQKHRKEGKRCHKNNIDQL